MVQVEDVCRVHPSPHRLLQPEGSEPQQQEQRHSQRHLLHRTQQTLRLLSQPGLGEEPGRDLCGGRYHQDTSGFRPEQASELLDERPPSFLHILIREVGLQSLGMAVGDASLR